MRYRETDGERKEREQKERIAQNVKEAVVQFKTALDSMPWGYGHSHGPGGITIFTEHRSPQFEDRLEILCTSLKEWCTERRIPLITVKVVVHVNEEALKRLGIEEYGKS